jgi:hypothetical protein
MRLRALLPLAIVIGLLVPAMASANTYCVPSGYLCAGKTASYDLVQQALNAAMNHPGADTVYIDACSCTRAGGEYTSPDPLDIIGAGVGSTILGTGSPVLTLGSASGSVTVSDLTIAVKSGTSVGLSLNGALAQWIDVEFAGEADASTGVELMNGGAFQNSTVTMAGGSARIGVSAVKGTNNRVDDALIDLGDSPGIGVAAQSPTGQSMIADVRQSTVAGSGAAGQYGVSVTASTASQTAALNLKDSVLSGVGHSIRRNASNGTALVTAGYSNFAPIAPADDVNSGSGTGSVTQSMNMSASPRFVDAASGDFGLSVGSALVDAGTPGLLDVGEPDVDLAGGLRLLDGNADCNPRRDIGAYELAPPGLVTSGKGSPNPAGIGETVTFDASGSCDPDPAASLSYEWWFDDGTAAAGKSVQHSFATPGPHSTLLTVTSSTGRSGSASVAVDVVAPPPPRSASRPTPPATGTVESLVLIAARPMKLWKSKWALVRLRCSGDLACKGKVELASAQPVKESATSARRRRHIVALGRASFAVPAKRSRNVKVRLSPRGLRLLDRVRRLPTRVTIRDRDSAGRRRTSSRVVVLRSR